LYTAQRQQCLLYSTQTVSKCQKHSKECIDYPKYQTQTACKGVILDYILILLLYTSQDRFVRVRKSNVAILFKPKGTWH